MKKKVVVASVIIMAFAAGTVFAGGGQQKTSPSGSGDSGVVEIRAAWWGDTKRHERYNKIIDDFEAANPGVKVVREHTSWADYWDKLSVQTAGGNAPDFMGMHAQYAADYIPRGVCAPLDKFVADGVISTQGWEPGTIGTGKFNGVLYMMPMGITYSCAYVNTGALKELGIAAPKFDWSWDNLEKIGLQVRAAYDAKGVKDKWFFSDISNWLNSWRYYVRQQGREIYNADGSIGFTAADAQSFWEMMTRFRKEGIVPDAATTVEYKNATLEDNLFSRDKILVLWTPVNQYKLYCDTFPDKNISIIRMATAPGKKVGEFPEGAHFAINAKSSPEKQLAAAKLLNFWINSETSWKTFLLDQGVPGNANMAAYILPMLDDKSKVVVDFVNKLNKIATPTIYPPAGASEIDALFMSYGEQVMYDQLKPADAAQKFYTESVAIRTKAKK